MGTEKELISAAKIFYRNDIIKYKKFLLSLYKAGDIDEDAMVDALEDLSTNTNNTRAKTIISKHTIKPSPRYGDGCGGSISRSDDRC